MFSSVSVFPVSLFLSLSLPVSGSPYFSLCMSLSISFSVPRLSLCASLSISPCLTLCLCFPVCVSLYLSLSLYVSVCVYVSLCLSLSLSLSPINNIIQMFQVKLVFPFI